MFSNRQSDEQWLAEIQPLYEAVLHETRRLYKALGEERPEEQIEAVAQIALNFPPIAEALKGISGPSSPEARRIRKSLNSAVKAYIKGAEAGERFFKNVGSGPGQAAQYESAVVQFSMNFFKQPFESGRTHMYSVMSYVQSHK